MGGFETFAAKFKNLLPRTKRRPQDPNRPSRFLRRYIRHGDSQVTGDVNRRRRPRDEQRVLNHDIRIGPMNLQRGQSVSTNGHAAEQNVRLDGRQNLRIVFTEESERRGFDRIVSRRREGTIPDVQLPVRHRNHHQWIRGRHSNSIQREVNSAQVQRAVVDAQAS